MYGADKEKLFKGTKLNFWVTNLRCDISISATMELNNKANALMTLNNVMMFTKMSSVQPVL